MKRSAVGARVFAVIKRQLPKQVALNPHIHSNLFGNSTVFAQVASRLSSNLRGEIVTLVF